MYKPIIRLERNNANNLFVSVTEFDANDYPIRAFCLIGPDPDLAEVVIKRRYADILRLTGDSFREGENGHATP